MRSSGIGTWVVSGLKLPQSWMSWREQRDEVLAGQARATWMTRHSRGRALNNDYTTSTIPQFILKLSIVLYVYVFRGLKQILVDRIDWVT